jgi:hypothetical protein
MFLVKTSKILREADNWKVLIDENSIHSSIESGYD